MISVDAAEEKVVVNEVEDGHDPQGVLIDANEHDVQGDSWNVAV